MPITIIDTLAAKNDIDIPLVPGNKVSGVEVTEVTTATHSVSTTSNREKFQLIVRLATIGAECTITIPTALFSKAGLEVEIIDADSLSGTYTIWVDTGGSETINTETRLGIAANGTSGTLRRISSTELVLR